MQESNNMAPEHEVPFPFEKGHTQAEADKVSAEAAGSKILLPAARKLETAESGQFALKTLDDQMSFASTLLKNQMISSSFKTPAQVVIAMQYLKEINMPMVAGLRLLYVVNSRPCLFSEGPLMLVQRSSLFESIEEFFFDENGDRISFEAKNLKAKVYGSLSRVKRKGDQFVQEDYFTLDDLATAKLDVGKNGTKEVWVKWQRIMMRYKARAIALRSKFADVIGGIPVAEYEEDFSPECPQINATSSIADELNAKYLQGKSVAQIIEESK